MDRLKDISDTPSVTIDPESYLVFDEDICPNPLRVASARLKFPIYISGLSESIGGECPQWVKLGSPRRRRERRFLGVTRT